jgi:hypothetical protein
MVRVFILRIFKLLTVIMIIEPSITARQDAPSICLVTASSRLVWHRRSDLMPESTYPMRRTSKDNLIMPYPL